MENRTWWVRKVAREGAEVESKAIHIQRKLWTNKPNYKKPKINTTKTQKESITLSLLLSTAALKLAQLFYLPMEAGTWEAMAAKRTPCEYSSITTRWRYSLLNWGRPYVRSTYADETPTANAVTMNENWGEGGDARPTMARSGATMWWRSRIIRTT